MSNDDVFVYGLVDEDETAGEGFEPYEEAAFKLSPSWMRMEDDAVDPQQIVNSDDSGYHVTVAEAYEAFTNEDLMPLAVRYRERDTLNGSPGTVVTYPGADTSELADLEGARVAVEDISKGTTMAFLTAAQNQGYGHEDFDLVQIPEEDAVSELESQNVDAAILDSEDWVQGDFRDVFNYNRSLQDTYGVVPPTQMWVADREQYQNNSEPFDDFVEWGESVNNWVEERIATSSTLEDEERQKVEIHERFGEFKPQDVVALQDISSMAEKIN